MKTKTFTMEYKAKELDNEGPYKEAKEFMYDGMEELLDMLDAIKIHLWRALGDEKIEVVNCEIIS
jgi:hypothetical protein